MKSLECFYLCKFTLEKNRGLGSSLVAQQLRIWHCHCYGLGHCSGVGLKKKKKKKKKKQKKKKKKKQKKEEEEEKEKTRKIKSMFCFYHEKLGKEEGNKPK